MPLTKLQDFCDLLLPLLGTFSLKYLRGWLPRTAWFWAQPEVASCSSLGCVRRLTGFAALRGRRVPCTLTYCLSTLLESKLPEDRHLFLKKKKNPVHF